MRIVVVSPVLLALSVAIAAPAAAGPISAMFTLVGDPNLAGRKPSAGAPASGDWLVGTADDDIQPTAYNPNGAMSHNFADFAGVGGAGFNMAPSLTGNVALQFTENAPGSWGVSATSLAYTGQATPVMFMNQFLVTPGSPATLNPAYNVDGLGNNGLWQSAATQNWAISYDLDFYFATNADGNPNLDDIDATFNDKRQIGYLIPVSSLTPAGLSAVALTDPAGFFPGNFEDYLLNDVAPLLPADATYLLFTQMLKTNPGYTESGLPITSSGLIGNTTIAYTTTVIPEPASLALLALAATALIARRRRGPRE